MLCDSGDSKLDNAVNGWLKIDKNPKTQVEVQNDIRNEKWDKLRQCMLQRQKFGTAGLRGRMGAGYMCMNDVVVLQTAQGLCSYILKECNQSQIHNGIVIGYDGRYNSKRFAELTAKVFVSASMPVRLFSRVCPTPLVSFATVLYHTAGGIMVTASHNPKEDNGYKVYWANGSQIITPHDDRILEEILNCLDIAEDKWDIEGIRSHALVTDCTDHVISEYMTYIRNSLRPQILKQNASAGLDVVYSAMHGVGYECVTKAFQVANLKPPVSVPQQQEPNPEFPTVKFPNPEEQECLSLSQQLAEEKGVRLVLCNDPDADRLAVAEYQPSEKRWQVFSGNEMGALLCWWLLEQYSEDADSHGVEDVYVIASVVSSKMCRAIVEGRGEFVETLTGFKWMGNTALLLLQQGKRPLFAFEEAIGYMCGAQVPDKDGVSAAVQVASLASSLSLRGSSLSKQIQALYQQYGFHICYNSYYICHDQNIIQKIFRRIRNYEAPGEYPKKVASCEIEAIHDLAHGYKFPEESLQDRHLKVLGTGLDLEYRSGEMVVFRCQGGLSVTLRTSGTEPKLKYYAELVGDAPSEREQRAMEESMRKTVTAFVEELLQPKENSLIG